MSELYPEDDPDRYEDLVNGLTRTYRALAAQENFTPHDMLLAIVNATALYATAENFDSLQVFEVQNQRCIQISEHRRAK
jgi:hypothetical protein